MPTLKRILSSSKGETLVETLAGVLICVLASVVLATGVVSAANINASAAQAAEQLSADQAAAARQSGGTLSGETATVTIKPKDPVLGEGETFGVDLYGGDGVVSYGYVAPPAETGGEGEGDEPDGEGGGA